MAATASTSTRIAESVHNRITVWPYLLATFAVSWALWAPVIFDKTNPVFLNLGRGPALVAMWFAATGGFPRTERKRLLAFALLIPVCWTVVVLNVRAASFPRDPVRFDWRLLLPSLISAWIVSGAFSNNAGTRSLLPTLVVPRKPAWCVIALVSLPAFMIATVIFEYALGLPVITPAVVSNRASGSNPTSPGLAKKLEITGHPMLTTTVLDS